MKERRQHPRFQVWLPLRLHGRGEALDAHARDMSRTGLFVETDQTWPVDTELRLTIELPGPEGPAEASARVVRVAEAESGAQGMGVVFVDVEPATLSRIDSFLTALG
jgi:uncharacterized protein (TIGR02266 family)